MEDHARASLVIKAVHYAYPPLVFSYYLFAVTLSICTLQTISPKVKNQRVRRDVILGFMIVVIASYVSEALGLLAHSLAVRDWYGPQHHIIYVLSSILVWGILVLGLLDSKFPVWFPYYGSWFIALAVEIALVFLPHSFHSPKLQFEYVQITVQVSRVCFLLLLTSIFFGIGSGDNRRDNGSDEESQSLLANGQSEPGKPQNNSSYGSVTSNNGMNTPDVGDSGKSGDEPDTEEKKRLKNLQERLLNDGNWWTYAKSFSEKVSLLGKTQSAFNADAEKAVSLGPNAGIGALRSYLWIPIDQYSYRAISTAAYNHIMNLSSDFHSNKKSGELYASIDQGRSINGFIDDVCFTVLPMLVDLIVAFGYFYYLFDAYMALIVGVVTVVYLWATTKLGAHQDQIRRDYRTSSRNEYHVLYESMGSWTTVCPNFHLGTPRGMFSCRVSSNPRHKAGGEFRDLTDLLGPTVRIAGQMLDAERLLELFQTKPSIKDKEPAVELRLGDGSVDFEDVSFSYDPRKPTLKNITFHAAPGKTVALVGETGGGKSTLLKLLFRFYDVASGCIKIDGQDIRDVTLLSLRENMGVVPQDPQLFNETIMFNLRYANLNATESEVHEACKAAAIHDKIMSFPDNYNSKVGERGIKLSGGELQRVSIARAILKNPRIILLDEATSMVDTETEGHIQNAFKKLTKDRTTFVVAHRLSTIMKADLILVIKDGEVVEQGTHNELLFSKGKYYDLWSKQVLVGASGERSKDAGDLKNAPAIINDLDHVGNQASAEEADLIAVPPQSIFEADKALLKDIASKVVVSAEGVLKPDAPEFVPKYFHDFSQKSDDNADGKGATAKETSAEKYDRQKREKAAKRLEKAEQKTERRSQKQKYQKEAKPRESFDGPEGLEEDAGITASSSQQQLEILVNAHSKPEKEKRRRFRYRGLGLRSRKDRDSSAVGTQGVEETDGYMTTASATPLESEVDPEGLKEKNSRTRSRRAKSKSAPDGQMDGADDSDSNHMASFAGNNSAIYQQRRSSAPSDPPAGPKDMRGSSQGQRRRRPRHWRNRSKTESKSTDVTASSSTETTSTQPPPTPSATPSDEASAGPSGQTSVRFAPGF
ncbi:hypothetical protein FGG08_002952 [Glutinoglossum americanum]|uniref:Heavy metal tolerance protein n=1 Tax=Glutinoglossum americanum TaxID=1670608 RepID=A0A9P8I3V6_9PEZI|nr:hypothetical protein FGG08_002952 [Glutinoglossum americanum]